MTDLSAGDRRLIERRDQWCLACGTRLGLTTQHRVSRGMGGLGNKSKPLTPADGIVLCWDCNVAAEGALQHEAIIYGWKVPRNSILPARLVPVFDRLTKKWYALSVFGGRAELPAFYAEAICAEVYEAWMK